MASAFQIRWASLGEIIPLRHEILRAGLPIEEATFAGDELSSSRHYGAFVKVGERERAVGCATLHFNHWQDEPAWQLRGMATSNDFRRRGVGRALLLYLEADVLKEPAPTRLFWANARTPAIAFYESMGWRVVSGVFEIPTAGPHVKIVRRLSDGGTGR